MHYRLHQSGLPRDLPSFPTRRSSDLREPRWSVTRIGWRPADLPQERGDERARKALPPPRLDEAAQEQEIAPRELDRKSTRLNSSHVEISYAVFCLKKKKKQKQ